MDRRTLLRALGGLTVAGLTGPAHALSQLAPLDPLAKAKLAFERALQQEPRLLGFEGTQEDFAPRKLKLEGSLPKAIQGHFFRNGPAMVERAHQRYLHLFEGDGMVHQFSLGEGNVRHQGKFVRTPKFVREDAAQKFLYSGAESRIADSLAIPNANAINTANTSVIPVGDALWALWEAGSPVALNPNTLDTHGIVNLGAGSRFSDSLEGMPFSAHPKVDPGGDIWNFGLAPSGHIVVYQLSPDGRMRNARMIDAGYRGGMLHDFVITEKHLLLILPSFQIQRNQQGLFSGIQFAESQPMEVLIISKQDLTLKRRYELEAGFAFHYGNAWEDTQGTIHFDASVYRDADALHHLGELMAGNTEHRSAPATTVLFQLKPDGTAQSTDTQVISEFPCVHTHRVGLRNQHLFSLSSTMDPDWLDTVVRIDQESGRQERYFYGEDFLVEEHIPISPDGKQGNGYLLGTALHLPSRRTCLNILREDALADGPVCRAWLPYHLPIGFHGKFVAA